LHFFGLAIPLLDFFWTITSEAIRISVEGKRFY